MRGPCGTGQNVKPVPRGSLPARRFHPVSSDLHGPRGIGAGPPRLGADPTPAASLTANPQDIPVPHRITRTLMAGVLAAVGLAAAVPSAHAQDATQLSKIHQ